MDETTASLVAAAVTARDALAGRVMWLSRQRVVAEAKLEMMRGVVKARRRRYAAAQARADAAHESVRRIDREVEEARQQLQVLAAALVPLEYVEEDVHAEGT